MLIINKQLTDDSKQHYVTQEIRKLILQIIYGFGLKDRDLKCCKTLAGLLRVMIESIKFVK